jgi:hypothetical protein
MRKLVERTNSSEGTDGADTEERPAMTPEPQDSGTATSLPERPKLSTQVSSWNKVKGNRAVGDLGSN